MGTFEEPKGGPLDIGKSLFLLGKDIGTVGRIYIPAAD